MRCRVRDEENQKIVLVGAAQKNGKFYTVSCGAPTKVSVNVHTHTHTHQRERERERERRMANSINSIPGSD